MSNSIKLRKEGHNKPDIELHTQVDAETCLLDEAICLINVTKSPFKQTFSL